MSSVTVEYFKEEMKKVVLKDLCLPQNAFKLKLVHTTDCSCAEKEDEKLVIVHYNPPKLDEMIESGSADPRLVSSLANIRGVIIDLDSGKVLLKSFPRTVNIITNSVPTDHLFPIYLNGTTPQIPSNGVYKKCYGGSLLRFFFHNGRARCTTHRKLDASNSFFGDSEMFGKIWLKDQDVFSSYNELYENSDKDVIHLFIINNRKLLVDSRENQDYDRVVYLKSYSMTDPTQKYDMTSYIIEKNLTSSKPIEICQIYTPEEVNLVLQGESVGVPNHLSTNGSPQFSEALFSNFSNGEKVIYENDFGIFTLTPSSCAFRQRINDGKLIPKTFADAMAKYKKNPNGLVKVGFSLESLREIASLLEESQQVNLADYTPIEGQANLCVLFNLIFTVPICRIHECFTAYEEFNDKIRQAIELLIERKDDLQLAILNEKLESYAGIRSMGTFFKKYLKENMLNLSTRIDGPHCNWADSAREMFNHYYSMRCSTLEGDNMSLDIINDCLAIISIVSNAPDDNLYSFITYKKKIEKEAEAMRKRAEAGRV